jgi:uncharacterized paraquat-inducible protein A
MNAETNITLANPCSESQHETGESKASAHYRWVKCIGCAGEIGVPHTWEGDSADCPQCGTQVRVNGSLQYRPPGQAMPVQAVILETRESGTIANRGCGA